MATRDAEGDGSSSKQSCKEKQRSVVYIHSQELIKQAEVNPRFSGRVGGTII